ncbi:MAG: hypothetical protein OD814_000989 [Candidatus Alkanophagales archaeon MCA70_species_1]|nr:hypothetical protein [Candidatus Alkanophaga volatiphilum]
MRRISELDGVVADDEGHGLRGDALDDDAVVARELELGAEVPAAARRAEERCERRLRDDVVTPGGRHPRPRQRTRHEYKLVAFIKWRGAHRNLFVQKLCGDASTPKKSVQYSFI